jgi:hypothetical protein
MGLGIGWRPELALTIERRRDLGFIEIVAENVDPTNPSPALLALRERGMQIIPHGISLSLGGAEPVDRTRGKRLADLSRRFCLPLVSEHIAFIRAGGHDAGHLLPVPRTSIAIDVLVENVKIFQDLLPVPLALENIAALFQWPDVQMSESDFLGEILDRTGALLLLDLANVWANALNLGGNAGTFLGELPLDRLAYVHVAGGEKRAGIYHDTHAAAVPKAVLDLVSDLCSRCAPPGVMLERDDHFPPEPQLNQELDAIAAAISKDVWCSEVSHGR